MSEAELSRMLDRLAQVDAWRNAPDLAKAIRREYQRNKDFSAWPDELRGVTLRLMALGNVTA